MSLQSLSTGTGKMGPPFSPPEVQISLKLDHCRPFQSPLALVEAKALAQAER